MLDLAEFLDATVTTIGIRLGADQATATSKRSYRSMYGYLNITSNSQQDDLHGCPRYWRINKYPTVAAETTALFEENVDFAFGHAVGAGIQAYLSTKDRQAALYACFLAWNADWSASYDKKMKSISYAHLAVEKFINLWQENWSSEWEIAFINGKAATEYTFLIDLQNGFFHAGHIDVILRHRYTGHYMILEIKTTSKKQVDEATYGNSGQALGYSVTLDKVVDDLAATARYEVLYLVYSTTTREYTALPFTKDRSNRIDWLQDLLLDHSTIATYKKLNFFPKRGNHCVNFNRRCKYYGICDSSPAMFGVVSGTPDFRWYTPGIDPEPEMFDYKLNLEELTQTIIQSAAAIKTEVEKEIRHETRRYGRKDNTPGVSIWSRKNWKDRSRRAVGKKIPPTLFRSGGRRQNLAFARNVASRISQ